ncbi:MAG TPA: hypothetical protein PLR28_10625 [Dokdonella sp.]|nr:hypothetical protein [Dokdonella sp.]
MSVARLTSENEQDVLHAMNAALCDFAKRWVVDGDYLRCVGCKRPILASFGSAFRHADGCLVGRGKCEGKPWEALVHILAPITPRLQEANADRRDALRYRGLRNLVVNERDDLLPDVPEKKEDRTADAFDAWIDAGIAALVATQQPGGAA